VVYFKNVVLPEFRARTDCTQWYTGVSGTISSYNQQESIQLAAQDYLICLRQELGTNCYIMIYE